MCYHREISGLRRRGATVVIKYRFPNYDASTKICVWMYIELKLIFILWIRWSLIVLHNLILYFMKTQFFVPRVPLGYLEKTFLSSFNLEHLQIDRFQCADYEYRIIFEIRWVIREILIIKDTPKNQFLAYKITNIHLNPSQKKRIRRRIIFSSRIYKVVWIQ